MSNQPLGIEVILPCPFCGGECVIDSVGGPNTPFQVECTKCTVTGPRTLYEKKAVAFWNKRVLCDEVEALRARVKELESNFICHSIGIVPPPVEPTKGEQV
jgi:Lar family restriction alleviation protein